MNLEPAPRLNKTPFVVTAAVCLAVVLLIGLMAPDKFAPLPFLTAVGFLIISITAIMIPILIDYAADSAEYVQQERVRANEQVQRLHAAGESLARAAAQIKAVEEAVHKTAHAAENLPYRMQEKLAEFNTALAEKEDSDHESLEAELAELRAINSDQLKTVAAKIQQATTELTALEGTTRAQLASARDAAAKVNERASAVASQFEARISAALATLETRLALLATTPALAGAALVAEPESGLTLNSTTPTPSPTPATSDPAPAESAAAEPTSAVVTPNGPAPSLVESVSIVEAPVTEPVAVTAAPEEVKARKPRPPRKPRPEDIQAAMSEPAPEPARTPANEARVTTPGFAFEAEAPEADSSPVESFRLEPTATAASSDGATRLLATAYIGIGNKLFIRGEGPGLSWDKGVPMQFVSIGKWGWATNDATGPVRCELYKNDETAALTGEVLVEPGRHVEVTALF